MAAFDLGLAFVSGAVASASPAWALLRHCTTYDCPEDLQGWQLIHWRLGLVAGLVMLIGATVTSWREPPIERFARRLIRRTLTPLAVALPLGALLICLSYAGWDFLPFLGMALLAVVAKFGFPAFVVTALWALACAALERPPVTR